MIKLDRADSELCLGRTLKKANPLAPQLHVRMQIVCKEVAHTLKGQSLPIEVVDDVEEGSDQGQIAQDPWTLP